MNPCQERILRGPNIWSETSVWELQFPARSDLQTDHNRSQQQLIEWLYEALEQIAPDRSRRMGFQPVPIAHGMHGLEVHATADSRHGLEVRFTRCIEQTLKTTKTPSPIELIGQCVMTLQEALDQRVLDSCAVQINEDREILVLPFEEEAVVRAVWSLVTRWWHAATNGLRPTSIPDDIRHVQQLSFDHSVGLTTRGLMDAARRRSIPVRRLAHESLIQLHYGAFSRRLLTTLTDRAGAIADKISDDKWLTKTLLRDAGFPVALARLVTDADDAWRVAQEIGLPVVIKPRDDDYGHGVSLHLTDEADVRAAYDIARSFKPDVLIERHAPGVHHRLFVLHDRVVAAVRRDPAQVVGDGVHCIRELVDEVNRDPRRNDDDPQAPLWKIHLGSEELPVLAQQGLTVESVPALGQRVPLRFDSRTSYGGTNCDCTSQVHPDIAALMIDAVKLLGLDVAGVDLLAEDIALGPLEQTLTILEINTSPSVLLHVAPLNETPQPLHDWLIEALFPHSPTVSFPTILITSDHPMPNLSATLAQAWSHSNVGVSNATGLWIGDRQLARHRADNYAGAAALHWHPRAEAAICELSYDSLRDEGLPVESAAIGLLLSADASRDDMALLASLVAKHSDELIVNVDDPWIAQWWRTIGQTSEFRSRVVVVSVTGKKNDLIQAALAHGQPVAYFSDTALVLRDHQQQRSLPLLTRSVSEGLPSSPSVENRSLERLVAVAVQWLQREIDGASVRSTSLPSIHAATLLSSTSPRERRNFSA